MAQTYNERLKRVSALANKLGSHSSTSSIKSDVTPEETESETEEAESSIFNERPLKPSRAMAASPVKTLEKMSLSPDRAAKQRVNLLKQ